MYILIAYDISTIDRAGKRRLQRVAKACGDYGVRVQKSLFECSMSRVEWTALKYRLLGEIDTDYDSLRFYFLDETARRSVEHFGVNEPVQLDGALIV